VERHLSVFILDTAKGTLLHHATHRAIDPNVKPRIVQSEHWVAYTYWKEASDKEGVKGHVVTVLEMFESDIPNERFAK
jgi:hypothetical protein